MGRYRSLIKAVDKQKGTIERIKNIYSEYSSINRKKALYSRVNWTDSQIGEFKDYWTTYYGKNIPDKWHRLYQSVNDVFRIDYFPEYLYSIYLEPKLNSLAYSEVFSDKNLLSALFGSIDELRLPSSYLISVNGVIFDSKKKNAFYN